jgi:unsaturated rhamnogalacturonyl hydrolase
MTNSERIPKSEIEVGRTITLIYLFLAAGRVSSAEPVLPSEFSGSTPLEWSIRMADSEMARRGDSLAWKPGGSAKWDYTAGLFTLSLLKLNERSSDPRYVQFAEKAISSFIDTNGMIQGYKAEEYQLDSINPGKTVLALYRITKDERYRQAARLLRAQLHKQPRTSEGGFWHKQRYPEQMWLDGIYMASPFYAQYAQLIEKADEPFDDVAKQIRLVAAHTYDAATGLFYHGWDEAKKQEWANKTTGTSSNFWGRAIGWYGMALVDVLDYFPTNHPARAEILSTLEKVCAGIAKYQDPVSGLWYQVMDQGNRKGDYLEATASAMFVYTLAKALNHSYVSPDYVTAAVKGYRGLIQKLTKVNGDKVSLTQCCSVAGLGYGRDGSFNYYVKEPVVDNDLKGVGPFILAGIEMQEFIDAEKRLQIGDTISIAFSDAATPVLPVEACINGTGTIVLLHSQTFVATNKTCRQLAAEIHDLYVPRYYHRLTVAVTPGPLIRKTGPGGFIRFPTTTAVEQPPGVESNTAPAASESPQMDEILRRTKAPVFPNRKFPITKFGAVPDGKTDCTAAIRRAIAAVHKAGGGRVVVPPGVFLTGAVHLQDNVDLHVEEGATLKFTTEPKAYLPVVFTRFEGMECYNYSPLIYAFRQTNIAVTGGGVLDGQASDDNWWQWKGGRSAAMATQTAARNRLIKMVEQNAPVEERRFGEGSFLRPSFVEPNRCANVLIEGVRIRGSPMWELHPLICTNLIVRGVDINSHGPNNDGCDPESCRNVLIENCVFETGDDCIAIKSGRNNDGRRVGLPSENIIVRGCTMKDGHGGVVIGSEISGGCRNVFAEECNMDSPNLERVLRLKSNAVRGGVIENIFMRNVTVGQVRDAVLQIDFVYEEGPNGPFKPVARNVLMENVKVSHTPRVLNVVGFPAAEISNIRLSNCVFKDVKRPDVVKEADVKLIGCTTEQAE